MDSSIQQTVTYLFGLGGGGGGLLGLHLLLSVSRDLVGVLDLHQIASLNSFLQSSPHNMLFDGLLETRLQGGAVLVIWELL